MNIATVTRKLNKLIGFVSELNWISDAKRIVNIMYTTYGAPVVNFFRPPVMWIFRLYKRAFIKLSYIDGKLSHKRAALVAVPVLAAFTWFFFTTGAPELYDFTADGVGMMTSRHKHVYLTGANPLPGSPDESIFQAKGCSNLPCSADTAMYYHIQPNSVKTLVNLVTKGTLYYPEEVEAAIPDQLSECDVTIQWWRIRMIKMYNTITEVSCLPVDQGK